MKRNGKKFILPSEFSTKLAQENQTKLQKIGTNETFKVRNCGELTLADEQYEETQQQIRRKILRKVKFGVIVSVGHPGCPKRNDF